LTTCVDWKQYPAARHRNKPSGVHLVWIGSSSTLNALETSRDLFEQVGAAIPGLVLKLICDRFFELKNMTVERCSWSENSEALELSRADIGISWLPDDRWSRGKCGLKILQYMAAGLPVVANPVGVHSQMVEHGITGFLAESPAEWAEAIGKLASDPDLRQRMGEAGRARLAAEYSLEAGASRWLSLLANLAGRQAA
jgi:glycosyltransferase involved in cell wall biosynthesis